MRRCHLVSIHGLTDNRSLHGRQANAPREATLWRIVDYAALHHEHDIPHGLDVVGRVTLDGDEVRKRPLPDLPYSPLEAQGARVHDGGGLQRESRSST